MSLLDEIRGRANQPTVPPREDVLHPDFSPRLKKEGSKTAKMYIAKQFQQFKV